MRADKSPQVFGPGSDPAVTKVLPFSINSGQCTAKPSPKKPVPLTSIFSWISGREMFRQYIQHWHIRRGFVLRDMGSGDCCLLRLYTGK